jgi:hypothetical protein
MIKSINITLIFGNSLLHFAPMIYVTRHSYIASQARRWSLRPPVGLRANRLEISDFGTDTLCLGADEEPMN